MLYAHEGNNLGGEKTVHVVFKYRSRILCLYFRTGYRRKNRFLELSRNQV